MKRVIVGKMYNTETATLIGNYRYGYAGDYHFVHDEVDMDGVIHLYVCNACSLSADIVRSDIFNYISDYLNILGNIPICSVLDKYLDQK